MRTFTNPSFIQTLVKGLAQADLASTQSALAQIDTILDQVLTDLADVSALIVDVRTNDEGNDYISLAIASRFTESPVHAYSKQARQGTGRTELQEVHIDSRGDIRYTGSIYLLTSRNIVSATEVFALAMTTLPHVTLVGEPSQGAFSDVLEWILPNSFEMGLSNEFYLTPNGQWREGEGVPVGALYRLIAWKPDVNFNTKPSIRYSIYLLTSSNRNNHAGQRRHGCSLIGKFRPAGQQVANN